MAEVTEAFKGLADRGFGQEPKTVQIEGSVTTGFKMVVTRRACRWPRCPSRSWCQRGCWRRTRTASQEPTARTATTARAEQTQRKNGSNPEGRSAHVGKVRQRPRARSAGCPTAVTR